MIKAYDFKSPKKFTKERMSTVENLYDSFSRSLAPYLTGLLQSYCEISINGIQEMRFQEYSAELDDRSLFGLITLAPENKDYSDAPMIFEMDTSLGFFMIERLLGGAGTEYELHRDFTDIEKAMLHYLLEKITGFIGDAWGGYMDAEVTLTGLQTNPHLLQLGAAEDVVILVELGIVVNELKAKLHIVMPAPNVEELTSRFGYKFVMNRKNKDEAKAAERQKYIEKNLLDADVEMRAVLHEFYLDAQDILQLQPGDVVPIGKNMASDIQVYVEDMPCFEAKPGHTSMHKAVRISKVL